MYIDCIFTPKNKSQVTKIEIKELFKKKFEYNDNRIRIESRNLECKFRIPQNKKYCSVLIEIEGSGKDEADILSKCKKKLKHTDISDNYDLTLGMDESSLYYSIKSYKFLAKYERNLRYLIYLTMIHTYGKDWVDTSVKDNSNIKNGINPNKISYENTLEIFSLNLISIYLFEKNPELNSDDFFKSVDNYLSNQESSTDEKLNNIIESISQYKGISIWEKYFNYDNLEYVEKNFKKIRIYRNDVMHHHNIYKEDFDNKKQIILKSNHLIKKAIEDIERGFININLMDVNISISKVVEAIYKASIVFANEYSKHIESALDKAREALSRLENTNEYITYDTTQSSNINGKKYRLSDALKGSRVDLKIKTTS